MTSPIDRRVFLAGSVAAATTGTAVVTAAHRAAPAADREYYELRAYRCASTDQRRIVSDYVEGALVPALGRMGIDRVGVFTVTKPADDASLHVLIPYRSLDVLARLNDALAVDGDYQAAAKGFFSLPKSKPAYRRVESRLMRAFASIPVIELPAQTKARERRIFELRTYESHNEDAARRKVEMFDTGETELMREVEMAPVFFGETLISDDVPNLTYMLSASDETAHKAHWQAFLGHAKWKAMKNLPRYKDTVSKIVSTFLAPTRYSQI